MKPNIGYKLAKEYGLATILVQNDISEGLVIMYLIKIGLVDPKDYFYKDVDQKELDLEE